MSGKTFFESLIDKLSCWTGFAYSPEMSIRPKFSGPRWWTISDSAHVPPSLFFSVSITGQRLYTAAALAKTRIFSFAGWKLVVDGNCSQHKVALAVAWAGQMSKFQELKRELSILEKTFGSDHEHLRVEANGLDEVTYRFLAPNGEHVVHCNIYVSRSFMFCTW